MNKISIISHRCFGVGYDENTLKSLKKAIKNNVEIIEIDIQLTKDLELIVYHNYNLKNKIYGEKKISKLNFSDIKKYEKENSKNNINNNFTKISKLEEFIDLILKSNSKLLIEVKPFFFNLKKANYDIIVNKLIDVISKTNSYKSIVVQSFSIEILDKINNLDKKIKLEKLDVLIIPFLNLAFDGRFRKLNINEKKYIKSYNLNYHFYSKYIFNFLKKNNKKISIWTCNYKKQIFKLQKIGVDKIITDKYNFVKNILK